MPHVVAGLVDLLVGPLEIGVREVFLHQFVDPEAAVVGTVFPADPGTQLLSSQASWVRSFFSVTEKGPRARGVEVGPEIPPFPVSDILRQSSKSSSGPNLIISS